MTQNAKLLIYLEQHPQGITQLEAFVAIGSCRLSERIRELEKLGYLIEHKRVSVPVRDGKMAYVMRYVLLSEPRYAYG